MNIDFVIDYLADHPALAINTALVIVVSIVDQLAPHPKVDAPRILRWLRGLVDLISILPGKGHPWRRGIQFPVIASSGRPIESQGERRKAERVEMPTVGLLLIVAAISGCSGVNKTLNGFHHLAVQSASLVRSKCGTLGENFAPKCAYKDASACKSLVLCAKSMTAIATMQAATVTAMDAVEAGRSESVIDGLISASVSAAARVRTLISQWSSQK